MTDYHLPAISAEDALAAMADGAVLLDIRKPKARAEAGQTIAGALARDPFAFSHDDPLTETEAPVVVFCVAGHEVSQFACALLLLHGRDARYVVGGYNALVAAGAPLVALD